MSRGDAHTRLASGAGLWLAVVLLVLISSSGCRTNVIPLEELAPQPIALIYWDDEAARARQEILAARSAVAERRRAGVAELDAVGSLLTGGASREKGLEQYPGHIVLLDPKTGDLQRFEAAPPNARPLAWSPDRRRLLFASHHRDRGRVQLYEYDLEQREMRMLTHGPAIHMEGDYAPDGRLVVAWARIEASGADVGVDIRRPDGGAARPLLEGVMATGVRWSPRDDRILFVQADPRMRRTPGGRDRSAIVVQAAEPGSEPDFLARGRDAVFSPDGEWVVFSAQTSRGWKLHRMRPDGSARVAIGASIWDERYPAVAPDGRHVLYVASDDAGIDRLYVRRFDGSADRLLLAEGSAAFPVW